jgi:polyhydroxyalkanoate synthesis regulator protein
MPAEKINVMRYAESRFHDATHGRYVSLAQLRYWAESGVALSVVDARTGEEIGRGLI